MYRRSERQTSHQKYAKQGLLFAESLCTDDAGAEGGGKAL